MPTKIIIYSPTAMGKTTQARQLSQTENIPLFNGENHDEIMTAKDARQFAEMPNSCIATIHGEGLESALFKFKRLLGFNHKPAVTVRMIPTIR